MSRLTGDPMTVTSGFMQPGNLAPGVTTDELGRVIEAYAKRFGYGVVRDFTGHGVGPAFHTGLIVPHYDAAPLHDTVIEPGMTFTIEPMLTCESADVEV